MSTTPRFVVLTGGPGAGKTVALEMVRHALDGVRVLPESASILFGGGFPRRADALARRVAQRAIYFVQQELESLAHADASAPLVLCDRGTLDALAYWPEGGETFFDSVQTTLARELGRYAAVIHLDVPTIAQGYRSSSLRIEGASEAAAIDRRIVEAWSGHPRRHSVPAAADISTKARRVMEILALECAEVREAGARGSSSA